MIVFPILLLHQIIFHTERKRQPKGQILLDGPMLYLLEWSYSLLAVINYETIFSYEYANELQTSFTLQAHASPMISICPLNIRQSWHDCVHTTVHRQLLWEHDRE